MRKRSDSSQNHRLYAAGPLLFPYKKMAPNEKLRSALATVHHAYFLGLQLMVARECGADVTRAWTFQLFRRQHEQYFLSGLEKLGLSAEPAAVACAKYHVLSNRIGGVAVEYAEESDRKAWVRFRYPRWMFDGPVLCGIPQEASQGFLEGWYAHNGVSLNNPKLGFVCVSEDMTGEFGFCGYFLEYEHTLTQEQRLVYARGELPPRFDPAIQPALPESWSAERLEAARLNYALTYIRSALPALLEVIGAERTLAIGSRSARLVGLQYYPMLLAAVGERDDSCIDAARMLAVVFTALGDDATLCESETAKLAVLSHLPRTISRGCGHARDLVVTCWNELWVGALRSQRYLKTASVEQTGTSQSWRIRHLEELAQPDGP
jgi:hypothetical protein